MKRADPNGPWSRITEHVDEKRITWAVGLVGHVYASGEATTLKEARDRLQSAKGGMNAALSQ